MKKSTTPLRHQPRPHPRFGVYTEVEPDVLVCSFFTLQAATDYVASYDNSHRYLVKDESKVVWRPGRPER